MRDEVRESSRGSDFKTYFEIRKGQESSGFFRPLNDAHAAAVEIFPEAGFIPLFRILKPIKIKVVEV